MWRTSDTAVLFFLVIASTLLLVTGCHVPVKSSMLPTFLRGSSYRRLQESWDYSDGDTGPDNWANLQGYAACGLFAQSPIDLPEAEEFTEEADGIIPTFVLNYVKEEEENGTSAKDRHLTDEVEFGKKGWTVEAFYEGTGLHLYGAEALSYIVGRTDDFTNNVYTLEQFHFHWGMEDETGSEHTIGGKSYPMEMHFVHYNSYKYESLEEAAGHEDGLLVIGVFFEIGDSSSEVDTLLQPIVDALQNEVFIEGDKTALQGFDVGALTSTLNTVDFYLYPGSLTTPGCNEIVTWVVLKTPLVISEATIEAFRSTSPVDYPDVAMAPNYRPTMDGNGRYVFDTTTQTFAAVGTLSSNLETDAEEVRKRGIIATVTVSVGLVLLLGLFLVVINKLRGK